MIGLAADFVERQRRLILDFGALSYRQMAVVFAVVIIFISSIFISKLNRNMNAESFFRDHFRLNAAIAFNEIHAGNSRASRWPSMSAMIQFDEAEFNKYLDNLYRGENWRPKHIEYRNIENGIDYSPDALIWRRNQFLPRYAGDRMRRWGQVPGNILFAIKNGRYLCFALLPVEPIKRTNAKVKHRAASCQSLRRTDQPTVFLKGALDLDRRILVMAVI